jgi:hypothetical protein
MNSEEIFLLLFIIIAVVVLIFVMNDDKSKKQKNDKNKNPTTSTPTTSTPTTSSLLLTETTSAPTIVEPTTTAPEVCNLVKINDSIINNSPGVYYKDISQSTNCDDRNNGYTDSIDCNTFVKDCNGINKRATREGNKCIIRDCYGCESQPAKICYYSIGNNTYEKKTHNFDLNTCSWDNNYHSHHCKTKDQVLSLSCPTYYKLGTDTFNHTIHRYRSTINEHPQSWQEASNGNLSCSTNTDPDAYTNKHDVCVNMRRNCLDQNSNTITKTGLYLPVSNLCEIRLCPQDILAGCSPGQTHTNWTPCTQICGTGTRTKYACNAHVSSITENCNTTPCAPHCDPMNLLQTVTNWSGCSKYCGSGNQTRSNCVSGQTENQSCNTHACPPGCDGGDIRYTTPVLDNHSDPAQNVERVGINYTIQYDCLNGNTARASYFRYGYRDVLLSNDGNSFVFTIQRPYLEGVSDSTNYVYRVTLYSNENSEGSSGFQTVGTWELSQNGDPSVFYTRDIDGFNNMIMNYMDSYKIRVGIASPSGIHNTYDSNEFNIPLNSLVPVHCVGNYGACDPATGFKTYQVTQPALFGGNACPYAHNYTSTDGCTQPSTRPEPDPNATYLKVTNAMSAGSFTGSYMTNLKSNLFRDRDNLYAIFGSTQNNKITDLALTFNMDLTLSFDFYKDYYNKVLFESIGNGKVYIKIAQTDLYMSSADLVTNNNLARLGFIKNVTFETKQVGQEFRQQHIQEYITSNTFQIKNNNGQYLTFYILGQSDDANYVKELAWGERGTPLLFEQTTTAPVI